MRGRPGDPLLPGGALTAPRSGLQSDPGALDPLERLRCLCLGKGGAHGDAAEDEHATGGPGRPVRPPDPLPVASLAHLHPRSTPSPNGKRSARSAPSGPASRRRRAYFKWWIAAASGLSPTAVGRYNAAARAVVKRGGEAMQIGQRGREAGGSGTPHATQSDFGSGRMLARQPAHTHEVWPTGSARSHTSQQRGTSTSRSTRAQCGMIGAGRAHPV